MKKRGMETEMVGWFAIAFAILVIMLGGYLIISGKLSGALEYVKNILRFGR